MRTCLALPHNGRDLDPDHGGPVRLSSPSLLLEERQVAPGLEFLDVNPPGFWEQNGYHMHADPWREERYSGQETTRAEDARRSLPEDLRDRR